MPRLSSRVASFFVGVVVFGAASLSLGAWDIGGDVAKFALGIEFPHPTLVTGIMAWIASWVGPSSGLIRLPLVALLGVAAALGFREAVERGVPQKVACSLMVALAFVSTTLLWTRDGYLPIALVAAWFVMAMGWCRVETEPTEWRGHAWMLLGAVAGWWTQLQGILVVPVIVWMAWRHRRALMCDRWILALYALAVAQIGVWGLGLLTNPLALGDLLSVGTRGVTIADRVQMLAPWAWWLVVAAFGWRASRTGAMPGERTFWLASSLPLLAYLVKNPANYYGPYGMWLLFWPTLWMVRAWPQIGRLAVTLTATFALLWHLTHLVPAGRTQFLLHGGELQDAVRGKHVAVIGAFPYDIPFHLLTIPRRWPRDSAAQAEIDVVLVWDERSLSAEERVLLGTFSCRLVGSMQVCDPRP